MRRFGQANRLKVARRCDAWPPPAAARLIRPERTLSVFKIREYKKEYNILFLNKISAGVELKENSSDANNGVNVRTSLMRNQGRIRLAMDVIKPKLPHIIIFFFWLFFYSQHLLCCESLCLEFSFTARYNHLFCCCFFFRFFEFLPRCGLRFDHSRT